MRTLGYLRRTLKTSTKEIKLLAYKTYVRPILEYASVVWDPHTQVNITKLENIQRKAIRFVHNSYSWRISPSVLLENAQLDTLQSRRYYDRQKLLYLIFHGKSGVNKNTYMEQVVARPTRSQHSKKFKDFSCRTDAFNNSFFPRTIREWNGLGVDIVECGSLQTYLSALKNNS